MDHGDGWLLAIALLALLAGFLIGYVLATVGRLLRHRHLDITVNVVASDDTEKE